MIDIEKLIELVKKHEFLYDIGHKEYKNPSLKTATWERIAKELNGTSDICKLKWKTVRDSYIKYKRLLKNSDGTKDIDYIWSSNLKFLDDHNVNRRSFYNIVGKRKAEADLQVREDISTSPPPLAPFGSFTMPPEVSSASFQSNQDLRMKIEDPIAKYKEIDATDLLFLSYSATFKKFPLRQQTFMKLELAKVFANAELQQLDDTEQSTVEATESLPVIIKVEYPERGELDVSEDFSEDMNTIKRKRRISRPNE